MSTHVAEDLSNTAAEAGPLIQVEDVSMVFGVGVQAYRALQHCDLELAIGEFLCLLGPSGCGKTTLLNLLAGFERPTDGAIRYKGESVRGPSPERVVCFQDSMQALLPWATVSKNIAYALRRRGITGQPARARINEVLQVVGLEKDARKYPPQLSGGMRQRVQIARALAVDPQVLLMDEPFGALDAITRQKMQTELLRVWEMTAHKSIVFVTHDVTEAVLLADRIAVMNKGPGSRIVTRFDVGVPRPRSIDDERIAALFNLVAGALDTKEVE